MLAVIIAIVLYVILCLKALQVACQCSFLFQTRTASLNDLVFWTRRWPIATVFKRCRLQHLYRLPVLVAGTSILIIVCQMPSLLAIVGGGVIFFALWTQILQTFLSRLAFGNRDIRFRRLSLRPPSSDVEDHFADAPGQATRDYILFIVGLIGTVIVGYAGAFAAIERYLPGSFSNAPTTVIDFVYFSSITFATIGYGDIVPLTQMSRLAVVTEIFASVICLVLLIFAYSSSSGSSSDSRNASDS